MAGGTKISKRTPSTPGERERSAQRPVEEEELEAEERTGGTTSEPEETLPEKTFNLSSLPGDEISAFTGKPIRNEKLPGRPRDRAKARKRVTPIQVVQAETPPPEVPLVDQKKQDRWQLSQEARDLAKGEVEIMTITVLSLMNGLVSMAYGEKSVMNKAEREMISEPLERILSRMDNVTKGLLAKYADPFLLITGLIAWGSRIRREALQRQEEENNAKAVEPAVRKVQENMPKNSRPKVPDIVPEKPFDYSQISVNIPLGGV